MIVLNNLNLFIGDADETIENGSLVIDQDKFYMLETVQISLIFLVISTRLIAWGYLPCRG